MFSDTASIVRVTQYVRRVAGKDLVSGKPMDYRVGVDWSIAAVDDGYSGVYIYGSPFQLFANIGTGGIYGDPLTDSRVFVTQEELPTATLPANAAGGFGTDTVHFKLPNI